MFLKQGNYQETYVCQKNLDFKICKKIVKSRFSESFFICNLKLENSTQIIIKSKSKVKNELT